MNIVTNGVSDVVNNCIAIYELIIVLAKQRVVCMCESIMP